MIDRYQTPEMKKLWSEESKYQYWLEVELAILEGWHEYGLFEDPIHEQIRNEVVLDCERIREIERVTKHDVAAFVDHVQEQVGEEVGRWFHYGVTSSDILDTATSLRLQTALEIISQDLKTLEKSIAILFKGLKDQGTIGRTHGIHAEPMTLGHLSRRWSEEIRRSQMRVSHTKETEITCQVSGPVGNYLSIPPEVEQTVSKILGIPAEPVSSQVIPRDRHAQICCTLAIVGAAIENIATEIRHRARTEVGEFAEGFSKGQKGSSAMPHKKNPILSENLCGLARMIRSSVQPSLENITLWHERDISHSSVERFTFENTTSLTSFGLRRLASVLDHLVIDQIMLENNLKSGSGRHLSHQMMLELIKKGYTRPEAYKIVQKAAFESKDTGTPFQDVLQKKVGKDVLPDDAFKS